MLWTSVIEAIKHHIIIFIFTSATNAANSYWNKDYIDI